MISLEKMKAIYTKIHIQDSNFDLHYCVGSGLERSPEARDDDGQREGRLLAVDQRHQTGPVHTQHTVPC